MKKIIFVLILISISFLQCTKDAASLKYSAPTGQGGSLARFAIVGNYLYTVDAQKLSIYDVVNPAEPLLKNTVNIGFEIETIFPFKDKLFIGSTSVVHIFSISDPANPQKLSQAISPDVLRRCDPVVAKDTVAFATLRTNGPCGGIQSILAVYDIKDITKPVQKASYPVSQPYGLGYQDNVLYVCDTSGLMIFDITKAYQPVLLKTIKDGDYVDVIPYQGTLICWINGGVLMYDITNNKSPILLAKIL
ncbi:MAG: hypothetical protein ABIN89_20715 [Chitinophagaceae bacterium]